MHYEEMLNKGPVKIHLGCGFQYEEGWLNIDINPDVKSDLCADFTNGLPMLPDSCASVIKSSDVVEHMIDKVFTINEFGRLLRVGGSLIISVPSSDSLVAHQDPTHVSYWNKNSFHWQYWTDPPSFLGLKYSFTPVKVEEGQMNHEGNKWVSAELMKLGTNKNYNPRVKSEYQRLKDRVKRLEQMIETKISPRPDSTFFEKINS